MRGDLYILLWMILLILNWKVLKLTCYTSPSSLNESAVVVKALHACCSVLHIAMIIKTAIGEQIPILITAVM